MALTDATRVRTSSPGVFHKKYCMQFDDLRLSEPLLRAVRAAGYRTPTPIQSKAIPIVLEGRDVLGCAQTGTGKTAAFALPVLQRLGDRAASACGDAGKPTVAAHDRVNERTNGRQNQHPNRRDRENRSSQRPTQTGSPRKSRVLVLVPTRELAQQIHDSFSTYGRYTDIRQTVVFGGVNQNPQVRALRAGVDVLIATPGRLLDLMSQGLANVGGTEILILDEADRMLDMGFLPDLRRILKQVPDKRQTLLFSATMPDSIRKLAVDILHDPVPVQVARISSPIPSVTHWVHHVEKKDKPTLLMRLMDQTYTRTLVFTRTKHGADKVVRKLVKAGVSAAALHGNKSQAARTRALAEFRSAQTPVLVATDIAARGLDVEDISHVINFDLTPEPETYVHRIGRTGRAGATGIAVSFCTSEEHQDLRAIERLLGQPLQRAADPGGSSDSLPAPRRAIEPVPTRSAQQSGPPTPVASRPPKRRSRPRRSNRGRGTRPGRPSTVSAA